jgi:hypothetical protein
MNTLARTIPLLILGPFFYLGAQESPSHQALIVDLTGTVTVQRAEKMKPEKAVWGMQLQGGDQIGTGASSSVSILFVNNTLITLGASSTITIDRKLPAKRGAERSSLDVSSAISSDKPLGSFRESGEGEVALLAGLRSSATDDIMLVYPRKSKIPKSRPRFEWNATEPFDRYVVSVYNESGIVWSQTTRDQSVLFPPDEPPLAKGQSYFWNVKGERMFEESRSVDMEFAVDDANNVDRVRQTAEDIRALFENDTTSYSYKFIAGSFWEQEGYLHEARAYFEDLEGAYSDAPRIHQILGNLYAKMGLKDLAISEFQKALQVGSVN